MNRLASQLISSMQGLLGIASDGEARSSFDLEEIRQAMLESLGEQGTVRYPHIERRVIFAQDLHALWYLRSDLMMALSSLRGEGLARQQLGQISAMFEGHLPRGMISRPASLHR